MNQNTTSRRDREPSAAAIVGNILAFGVVRALARTEKELDQCSPLAPEASALPRRSKKQITALK